MWLRRLGNVVAVVVATAVGVAVGRRLGGAIGFAAGAFAVLWNHLLLPRSAHAAFARGAYRAAAWRYRWLARTALSRRGTARAGLSAIACQLGLGHHADGLSALDAFDGASLDVDGRAVLLNNRAHAALRRGDDPARALAWAEAAAELRPDVPAIAHTRAMALIQLGRVDQAITLLEAIWAEGALAPRLEAERCWELGQAWRSKGEAAYGDDYQSRARRQLAALGPLPPWAEGATPSAR